MLPNEVFALACRAYYDEQGITVDEKNGEFAHCPYPESMGDTGYYLLHDHHQQQGILQSRDVNRCCFFIGHAKKWLIECDPIPDNFFELWDIYEKYAKEHCTKHEGKVLKSLHSEKDDDGKSKFAVQIGKKGGEATFVLKKALFDPVNTQRVREGNVRGCRKAASLKAKPIELTKIETGETLVFPSTQEASRVLGVNQSNLSQCARGKRPSCQGFTARYI